MEDWIAFVETHSLYLFRDLPWPTGEQWRTVRKEFEAQWTLLREGALFFLRYEPNQHTVAEIERHAGLLLEYGKRVETVCHALWRQALLTVLPQGLPLVPGLTSVACCMLLPSHCRVMPRSAVCTLP